MNFFNDTEKMEREFLKMLAGKINSQVLVKERVDKWKAENKKIVFSNGVFDVLHIGHVTYLAKAARLGDKLIIGLNADSSVKKLKGDNRPLNAEPNRAMLLAALLFVDAIVVFEEDTPLNLIKLIMPDVLVKGSDYNINDIIGGSEVIANGGEVITIDFVDGYSSTSIIEKMAV